MIFNINSTDACIEKYSPWNDQKPLTYRIFILRETPIKLINIKKQQKTKTSIFKWRQVTTAKNKISQNKFSLICNSVWYYCQFPYIYPRCGRIKWNSSPAILFLSFCGILNEKNASFGGKSSWATEKLERKMRGVSDLHVIERVVSLNDKS